jgi:hypothetical protein
MITSTTPYKLAEIIMDTWPNLYRPPTDYKPPVEYRVGFKTNLYQEGAEDAYSAYNHNQVLPYI